MYGRLPQFSTSEIRTQTLSNLKITAVIVLFISGKLANYRSNIQNTDKTKNNQKSLCSSNRKLEIRKPKGKLQLIVMGGVKPNVRGSSQSQLETLDATHPVKNSRTHVRGLSHDIIENSEDEFCDFDSICRDKLV